MPKPITTFIRFHSILLLPLLFHLNAVNAGKSGAGAHRLRIGELNKAIGAAHSALDSGNKRVEEANQALGVANAQKSGAAASITATEERLSRYNLFNAIVDKITESRDQLNTAAQQLQVEIEAVESAIETLNSEMATLGALLAVSPDAIALMTNEELEAKKASVRAQHALVQANSVALKGALKRLSDQGKSVEALKKKLLGRN